MDPTEVLKQFVDLCNNRSGFLKQHLASNAVLEWFGRTIRGGDKICQYYRYDLCLQYEHHFQNAQQCDPIECKPSHMQTKQLPTVDNKAIDSKSNKKEEYITPISSHSIKKLPAVTQGRKFLFTHDDLDDLGLCEIKESVTPPQISTEDQLAGEPLAKRHRTSNEEISKNNNQDVSFNDVNLCKKCDTTNQKMENISKCVSSSSEICSKKECSDERACSTQSEGKHTQDETFSNLKYLESTGTVQIRNKSKHRGVTGYQNLGNSVDTDYSSPNNTRTWEKETKLKLSYRIKNDSNHLQFALIIYEHASRNPMTRRNLLAEFQKVNKNDSKIKKKSNPPQLKHKTALKRSFRLF